VQGLRRAVEAAVRNVAAFADTDIFHEPFELGLFRREPQAVVRAVLGLHRRPDLAAAALASQPCLRRLVPVGASGYRLATLIDPVWNAYYLALTLLVARAIEAVRPATDAQVVFSYRHITPDAQGRIFDPAIGWRQFIDRTQALCGEFQFVVQTDVAEFYHRITPRHVRVALDAAGANHAAASRLADLLGALGADEHGLPVGGPASRILAEAVLARADAQLLRRGVRHCRFVDDYRLFARTQAEAQRSLYVLAEVLWEVGLSLQRAKTRVVRAREQLEEIHLARAALQMPVGAGPLAPLDAGVVVDPYSELRAQGDGAVAALALHAEAADIIRREFSKTRANPSLARRVLGALRHMPRQTLEPAVQTLLEPRLRAALEPVLLRFLAVLEDVCKRLSGPARRRLARALEEWLMQQLPPVQIPAHEAAVIALSSRLPGPPRAAFLRHLQQRHSTCNDVLVRREIALYWGAKRRLAELAAAYGMGPLAAELSPWEKRAVAVARAAPGRVPEAAKDRALLGLLNSG
jgi:hypothetical protein